MRLRVALCALALGATPASAQSNAVDALFDLLCGRTVHFYDESGNQIEYTSGDGTAYLWFHDRPEVIVGTWGVYDTEGVGAQVCYEYDPGAFGPLDTGGLHCFTQPDLFATVVADDGVVASDRYGLADGTPPFVLPEHPLQAPRGFDADFPDLPPEPACGVPIS